MKKVYAILLSILMVFGLAACSDKKESNENTGSYKVGVGSVTSISANNYDAEEDKNGRVQYNTTYAALVVDGEGKIVYLAIDTAQNTAVVEAGGVVVPGSDMRTKKELKEEYNMVGASGIGKEWYEQIAALETYAIGKTVEEFISTANDDADLATSVTIDIMDYIEAVRKANENLVAVENGVTYGVGSVTSWKASSYNADDEKNGSAQINTTFAFVVLNAEGKMVYVAIDTAQFSSSIDAEGTVSIGSDTRTKKEQKEDYGMAGISGIGKEWYEQIAALEAYAIGKTVEEFVSTASDDADLTTSVTIDIAAYIEALEKAVNNVE